MIDERPYWNPAKEFEALKPFYLGTVDWYSMQVTHNLDTGTEVSGSSLSSIFVTLYSTYGSDGTLAYPQSGNGSNMTDKWVACGHWDTQ